jgi:GNAT superfamily N-acetyltransferase
LSLESGTRNILRPDIPLRLHGIGATNAISPRPKPIRSAHAGPALRVTREHSRVAPASPQRLPWGCVTPQILLARSADEILATYEVMQQLRPHVKRDDYVRLVQLQTAEVRFELAYLTEDGCVTCVAGFRLCRSLGWGKYLYVDDLVTDAARRSTGAGKMMFQWLVDRARSEGCQELRLDSAVYRHAAHRFYMRERMDIACFNFRLEL